MKKLMGFLVMAFVAGLLVTSTVGCGDGKATTKSTKTTETKTPTDTKMETKMEEKPK